MGYLWLPTLSSVQFSPSVMSNSLWPHGLQHARLPRPSPTPRFYSNSCPLSGWCHPTISSSVVPFSCLQSLPASGSFPVSGLFVSGGQRIGASASTSVFPMNIQDWFLYDCLVWSPVVQRPLKSYPELLGAKLSQWAQMGCPLWSNRHSQCGHIVW